MGGSQLAVLTAMAGGPAAVWWLRFLVVADDAGANA
jgi:hypothetical protein